MNSTRVEDAEYDEGSRGARHRRQGVPGVAPRPAHRGHAVPAARSSSSWSSATRRASTSRRSRPSSSGRRPSSAAGLLPAHRSTCVPSTRRRPRRGRGRACSAARRSSAVVTPSSPSGAAGGAHRRHRALRRPGRAARLAELEVAATARPAQGGSPRSPARRAQVEILFNPDLRTAVIMIPGLCGIILVFVGTIATALGRGARAPGGHHGAARRHAVPPARRVLRQDRPVPAHRRRSTW